MDQSEYISKLEAQNKLLLEQVTLLTYEQRDMKRLLFGRKSERFLPQPPAAQLNLAALMAEAVVPPVVTQEVKVVKKQVAEVKPTGRHALPAHLPKVDIVLEPMEWPTEIPLLGYISHLCAIYSFIKWKQIQKRVEIPQFPAIKVRFAYQDINNSIHKKEN